MREGHETVNEITSTALTKAFLNCNELPKSELCAVQVPSSPRRTPSYKTPPYTRIYPGIPVAAWPPHVMNIFTLIGRLGIFHLARRCARMSRSVSIPSILYLYRRRTGRVCLFSMQFSSHRNSRMSDESGPTLMILSSLPGNPWSLTRWLPGPPVLARCVSHTWTVRSPIGVRRFQDRRKERKGVCFKCKVIKLAKSILDEFRLRPPDVLNKEVTSFDIQKIVFYYNLLLFCYNFFTIAKYKYSSHLSSYLRNHRSTYLRYYPGTILVRWSARAISIGNDRGVTLRDHYTRINLSHVLRTIFAPVRESDTDGCRPLK